jgi:hypothetical protein
MTLTQQDSTYAQIEKKIRHLTASASQSALSSSDVEQYVNTFYNSDFPYGIKIDQMRSVYTFFTQPYIDRYPLDVNYNQGVRAPVYVEGIQGSFFKDRQQFYALWPRFPTKFQPISGNGTTTSFIFNIPGPFLSREFVLGGVDVNGNPISVNDDGNGNLQLQIPNAVTSVPTQFNPPISNPAIPGMYNRNLGNPGLNNVNTQTIEVLTSTLYTGGIGTVNYVTGDVSINFPVAPASGQIMTCWVSQYQTGRPYNLLFWNNEFTIRPVPKLIHKVEVEVFLTPVQFMQTTDSPILNQWAQYIAYGTSMEILRDRQDMEGVENLREGFMRQEGLVLERQAVEEIFTPNPTIFNSVTPAVGGVNGIGYFW